MLRILGIRENELDTHEDTTTRINNDEVKKILKKGPEKEFSSQAKSRRHAFTKKPVLDNGTIENVV